MTYATTEAGKQIERALEQGYEIAAFNLYVDAFENDVTLVMGEGSAEWHRDIQKRIGLYAVLDVNGEEAETSEPNPPYQRDASGRVIG